MSNEKSAGNTQSKAVELIEDELDSVVGGGTFDFKSVKGKTSKELKLGDTHGDPGSKWKVEERESLRGGLGERGFATEEIKPKG